MVMAHLPILSQHVLKDMNVEALTADLRSLSKTSRSQHTSQLPSQSRPGSSPEPPSDSSLASSVELVRDADLASEKISVSAPVHGETSPRLGESQMSWDHASAEPSDLFPQASEGSGTRGRLELHDFRKRLSDSLGTTSSAVSSAGESVVVSHLFIYIFIPGPWCMHICRLCSRLKLTSQARKSV